ncbi:uncharacterized protein LOC119654858 [Hermetia illucens]|uniref:uncharacterized protein LOC119654858 n=1 Tax=Hermetia illucens TaxID=343691 RepID=UPI0018CBFB3D|nr:uncharacterized protein LOC119654858 [Hermetia illucens]
MKPLYVLFGVLLLTTFTVAKLDIRNRFGITPIVEKLQEAHDRLHDNIFGEKVVDSPAASETADNSDGADTPDGSEDAQPESEVSTDDEQSESDAPNDEAPETPAGDNEEPEPQVDIPHQSGILEKLRESKNNLAENVEKLQEAGQKL